MMLRHVILYGLGAALLIGSAGWSARADSPAADAEMPAHYGTQGFFMSQPMAVERERVTFHLRATGSGPAPTGTLTLKHSSGQVVREASLSFTPVGERYEAQWSWAPLRNGLYSAAASLHGEGYTFENTRARDLELLVPVIVKGRELHFPWYRPSNYLRWITVSTSTGQQGPTVAQLRERGVKALQWTFGGMQLHHQDWMKGKSLEEYETYVDEYYKSMLSDEHFDGVGVDEFGGYPGTGEEEWSRVGLEVLARLRQDPQYERAFVAAWHGGMLRPDLAELYKNACDLLLIETYVFGAMPAWLGTENIYAMIDDKVMAGARGVDILIPSYGPGCTTIQCLDIVGIPAKMHTGEVEQVVRYLRRIVPEMRGLGFYNCVDFPEGSTPEMIEELERFGDEMCLQYFIKPVVTLMQNSLWVERDADGSVLVCVGVSNLGAMDSGPVRIGLYANGRRAGVVTAEKVPAGPSGHTNRVVLKAPMRLESGQQRLEAVVEEAAGSTVLDGHTATGWYLEP